MSKPPDIWMLFQTVVSKFLRLITKKIIKNRAIFDILLIHNLGIDMVCGGDIMELQVASALPPQGGEQKMALKAGL